MDVCACLYGEDGDGLETTPIFLSIFLFLFLFLAFPFCSRSVGPIIRFLPFFWASLFVSSRKNTKNGRDFFISSHLVSFLLIQINLFQFFLKFSRGWGFSRPLLLHSSLFSLISIILEIL